MGYNLLINMVYWGYSVGPPATHTTPIPFPQKTPLEDMGMEKEAAMGRGSHVLLVVPWRNP